MFRMSKINKWHFYKHESTAQKTSYQGKPLVIIGAGFHSGNKLINEMIYAAHKSWRYQKAPEKESINAVVIVTIPRNDEEALVSVLFNPKIEFNENSHPALEMDAYVKAVEYVKAVSANKMRSNVLSKQAVNYIAQEKAKEITWN